MPRVAGGQHTLLPWTQAIVIAVEDALKKCYVRPVERSYSRACSGGYRGFEGRAGGGKLFKEQAKLLFPRHFLHLHYRQQF